MSVSGAACQTLLIVHDEPANVRFLERLLAKPFDATEVLVRDRNLLNGAGRVCNCVAARS